MTPSIADLYLAFRQAKSALYFEHRGVGLIDLANFENNLMPRLKALRKVLAKNDGWFGDIEIGDIWLVPKKLSPSSHAKHQELITRIGTSVGGGERRGQIRRRGWGQWQAS